MGFKLTTLVVIDIGCKGSCKSNYRTITTMTALLTREGKSNYHTITTMTALLTREGKSNYHTITTMTALLTREGIGKPYNP